MEKDNKLSIGTKVLIPNPDREGRELTKWIPAITQSIGNKGIIVRLENKRTWFVLHGNYTTKIVESTEE